MRYFDASALAKRYMRERESALVQRLYAETHCATSRISEVEVVSALVRRCREGDFQASERDRALAALRDDLLSMYVVELNPEITAIATDLLLRYKLGAGDSIQLASALFLLRSLDAAGGFVAFDDRLVQAARAEGLTVCG
jgi:predicted nucleic acid-binding protein